MALIPYEHLPPPHDPALTLADQPIHEFYCGDARCDCATAHVIVSGVQMSVDLGTTRVDLVDQQKSTPAHQALAQTLRAMLRGGDIATLRTHYAKVREFGLEQHFRYVDWTGVKAGEFVAWEQIFRQESVPMWTMTTKPPAPPATEEQKGTEGGAEGAPAGESFLLGLGDAYCIEPKCDCQRVRWVVVTAPVGQPNRGQTIGSVELSFATGQHQVVRTSPNVQPNQLYILVHNLLRGQPHLPGLYQQRYELLRQHMTPLLQAQRRHRSEAHHQDTAGRNDPCPCGSGKKFKKCHGR